VNDTGSRFPETNVVFSTRCRQKVIDLLVDLLSSGKIFHAANLGLDQMVAVDGGRVCNGGHAGRHELENSHLGGGILASHTIRAELEVRHTTLDLLAVGIVEMGVENLFGVCERPIEPLTDDGKILRHLLVIDEVALFLVVLGDLLIERRISECCHSPREGSARRRTQQLSRQHDCDSEWRGAVVVL